MTLFSLFVLSVYYISLFVTFFLSSLSMTIVVLYKNLYYRYLRPVICTHSLTRRLRL